MERSDACAVAEVHGASFEGFFLSFLGDRFLQLYYESICDFRQLCFVAERNSEIIGFVAGIDDSFGFYQSLLKYRIHKFAIATIPTFFRRPSVAPRLLRRLFRRSHRKGENRSSATLTSIAVRPDVQNSGLGHELLRAFVNETVNRGIDRIYLETDAVGNEPVCRFYEKEGFVICREYTTPEMRKMREYFLDVARIEEQ